MGVQEKRSKHKEEFRREILDAARDAFLQEGYESFSMRKLAARIDYSPTTIYLYFKGKDDLLSAICREFYGQLHADLERIRTAHRDPVEALRQALLHLVAFGIRNPSQYRLIYLTKRSARGTHQRLFRDESMPHRTLTLLKEIVRDCIGAGRMRDMDEGVIALTLAVAAQGMVSMTLYAADIVKDSAEHLPEMYREASGFLGERGEVVGRALVDALLRGFER